MNQVIKAPDKASSASEALSSLSQKTAYERRLDVLYASMEQQDYRAYRRARQIAMGLKHDKGITQAEIAERVGWTQGNLALYLNGHKAIGRNVLPLMCIALECEPHDIRTELKDPRDDQVQESARQAIKRQVMTLERWLKDPSLPDAIRKDMEDQQQRMKEQYAEMASSELGINH